jgi:hypothetical protein
VTDRPSGACVTHRPPRDGHPWRLPDPGYACCSPCYDKIHRMLSPLAVDDDGRPDSVPALYAILNPRPGSVGDSSGIRPPGFGSRSPANDRIIAMRDKRSVRLATGDPHSVPGVLISWCTALIEERGLVPPERSVPAMCRFLDAHLDWVTRQSWLEDFYTELREIHAQLRAVGAARRRIGSCPTTIDEGDHTRLCGAALLAPLHGDTITCPGCGREWQRIQWLRLGQLLDAG